MAIYNRQSRPPSSKKRWHTGGCSRPSQAAIKTVKPTTQAPRVGPWSLVVSALAWISRWNLFVPAALYAANVNNRCSKRRQCLNMPVRKQWRTRTIRSTARENAIVRTRLERLQGFLPPYEEPQRAPRAIGDNRMSCSCHVTFRPGELQRMSEACNHALRLQRWIGLNGP